MKHGEIVRDTPPSSNSTKVPTPPTMASTRRGLNVEQK